MSNEVSKTPTQEKFKSANWGVAADQLTNRQRWICFWSLFAFGTCCVYQWLIPASILTFVAGEFNMGIDTAGWIMSVFTITGLILAFPGAWVMRNIGIKTSLMVTAALTIVGNILAFSAVSGEMFLVARCIQGCGFGMIAVIGPNVMPRLFPIKKMGLVMGIWSQWVCPGIAFAALSTPLIYQAAGWRACFVLSLILQIVTTLLVLVFVKLPAVPENELAANKLDKTKQKTTKQSRVYVICAYVVGFTFLAWCISYPTFNTFFPTYAQTVVGMDLFSSSLTTLVAALVTVPGGILFGVLADKLNQRKWMLIIGYVILIVLCPTLLWSDSPTMVSTWVAICILGFFCAGLIPTMTRAIIPVLAVEPRNTDYALATMAFVTQLGGLLAAFFGTFLLGGSYSYAALCFIVPICVVAVIVLFFVKNDRKIKTGTEVSEDE